MVEKTRLARGARIPGLRVAYQRMSGERREADALYLGERVLFICTDKPLAAGGRFALTIELPGDIQLPGDGAPRSAVGRVVSVREAGTSDAPSGMNVKLIEVEEAVVAAIERRVAGERVDPGVGAAKTVSRERTMLGTGLSRPESEVRAAPVVVLAPTRERTVLGVAPPSHAAATRPPAREVSSQEPAPEGWDLPEPAAPKAEDQPWGPAALLDGVNAKALKTNHAAFRDPSIAIDLSELERSGNAQADVGSARSEPSGVPAGVPRHRRRFWLMLPVVLALAAGLGYARRDKLQPLLRKWRPVLTGAPTPAAAPSPLRQPAPGSAALATTISPTLPTEAASASAARAASNAAPAIATATPSSSSSLVKAPSASAIPNQAPSRLVTPLGASPLRPKHSGDNPY
jgi:hypothetical protein